MDAAHAELGPYVGYHDGPNANHARKLLVRAKFQAPTRPFHRVFRDWLRGGMVTCWHNPDVSASIGPSLDAPIGLAAHHVGSARPGLAVFASEATLPQSQPQSL